MALNCSTVPHHFVLLVILGSKNKGSVMRRRMKRLIEPHAPSCSRRPVPDSHPLPIWKQDEMMLKMKMVIGSSGAGGRWMRRSSTVVSRMKMRRRMMEMEQD